MEKEPVFSDWEVKRIRYRLLVYLRHLQYAYDNRDKSRLSGQTSKRGEAGRVAAVRPSLETIASQIQNCDEAENWVNWEILPKGEYKWIEESRGNAQDQKTKTTAITYQKLFLFVIGEPDKKSHNFPRQKFNKPNPRSLKGIYEFLKVKSFIAPNDMIEPASRLNRNEAIAFFKSHGLEPQEIHENEYFNGDYIAVKTAHQESIEFTILRIQTEKERVYNRRTNEYEPPKLYKARIESNFYKGEKDSFPIQRFLYEGLGVFNPDAFAVFYYQLLEQNEQTFYIGNIGSVKRGETKIADHKIEKTRKVVTIPNQTQLFSHALNKLPTKSTVSALQTYHDKSGVLNFWDSVRIYGSKHVFEKVLQNKLLFDNIGGIMSEDNNNEKGADKKKRQKLTGKAFMGKPENYTVEYGTPLSDTDMNHDILEVPTEGPLADINETNLERWQKYKNEGFNSRLFYAAAYQDLPVAEEAIRHGADVNYIHPSVSDPIIIIAARNSAYYVVKRLLECEELNLLVKDQNGRSTSEILSYDSQLPQSFIDMVIEAEMKQARAVGNTIQGFTPIQPPEPHEP